MQPPTQNSEAAVTVRLMVCRDAEGDPVDLESAIWDSQHSCSFFWGGVLYEWALIVLPFFLESSGLSLELADYMGPSTF